MKFLTTLFLFTFVLSPLVLHAERLNDKQVETLLTSGFSSADVQAQLNQKGYSGAVDPETLQRLKKEGADADLILLLKSKVESAPASEPPKPNTPDSVSTSSGASSGSGSQVGDKWTNSLGMQFVPVPGTQVLFSIWDTRVKDYKAFSDETGRAWQKPDFKQSENHPAVKVSWEDAKAFCKWLTKKEHESGELATNKLYRLPTEAEWNVAVGNGDFPWPWGNQWPPPKEAGNYSSSLGVDNFANTSPVGSFPANKYGLYDMGGNVNQWCEDWYDSSHQGRVLHGGSWKDGNRFALMPSFRGFDDPGVRNDLYGFRVVCEVGSGR